MGCVAYRLGSVVLEPGDEDLPCPRPDAFALVDWLALDDAALRCDPGFEVSPYDGVCTNTEPDDWRFLVACSTVSVL